MSDRRVRLGDGPVVHEATAGGWTACGVMYGSPIHDLIGTIRFMSAIPTGDPVDCMACLVQETRGPSDTLTLRATLTLPIPVHVFTFVIDPGPKK